MATEVLSPNVRLPRAQQNQAQPVVGVRIRLDVSQESIPIFESITRLVTGLLARCRCCWFRFAVFRYWVIRKSNKVVKRRCQ